ncbi:uncharacterized protein L201_005120 [Kwoniella dendrophila CBS 6074]|uniref:WD-repeat protein n=1 Tax=Kwoniella dendrophila CBS 6074 TaxID=1295534 RepID=A0AAX4JY58_9TREE
MSGPLGDLPGMKFDPVRNRYFPIPKGPITDNQTEEDTRARPVSAPGPSNYSDRQLNQTSSSSSSANSTSSRYQNGSHGNISYINDARRAYVEGMRRRDTSIEERYLRVHAQYQSDLQHQRNLQADRIRRSIIPNSQQGEYNFNPRFTTQSQFESNIQNRRSRTNNDNNDNSNNNDNIENDNQFHPNQGRMRTRTRMRNIEELSVPQPDCFSSQNQMKRIRSNSSSTTKEDQQDQRENHKRIGKLSKKSRFGIKYNGNGIFQQPNDRNLSKQDQFLSDLEWDVEHHACGCHGEIITSYRAFGDEAYYATTDHGKLIMHQRSGNTAIFSVCAQNLVGMHCDIPRLTMIAIAGGSEPHLHLFKRDPEMLDHAFMTHSELNLQRAEMYSVSSFDDVCTIGGTKALTTLNYTTSLRSIPRRLHSDALAIHQTSRDLVYVGQRSGHVSLEDLRTSSRTQNIVASTIKGKAVVGVKRLSDSAVPWGLVVSGMSHEMLLFDVRYGDKPLRAFEGHFNTFHTSVALTTSPNDKTLFASSSDRRIKAWSIITGDPLLPPTSVESTSSLTTGWDTNKNEEEVEVDNPLNRVFSHRVSHLDVNDELGLDVVVRGDLYRFGRK